MSWQERAACVKAQVDPETFFPTKNNLKRGNEAIMLCFTCEVRAECKMYREQSGSKYGIWAGEYTRRTGTDN